MDAGIRPDSRFQSRAETIDAFAIAKADLARAIRGLSRVSGRDSNTQGLCTGFAKESLLE